MLIVAALCWTTFVASIAVPPSKRRPSKDVLLSKSEAQSFLKRERRAGGREEYWEMRGGWRWQQKTGTEGVREECCTETCDLEEISEFGTSWDVKKYLCEVKNTDTCYDDAPDTCGKIRL